MSDWRPLAGRLAGWTCGQGPRLVFVHGFTQTANSWKPIAAQFAGDGYESIVVDAPGHGDSTNVRADLRRGADMLTTLCGFGVYVGYGLGGRLCMHAALMYPHLVSGLAVVGASPGIADESDRAARRAADNKLADHIEDVGVEAFLDEWLAQPLFTGLTVDDDQRADRLTNTSEGLASSLRHAGTGAQGSLWPRLRELNMPVLTIAGEHDEKFTAIGRQIASSVPQGQTVEITGAGHAAHLQDPGQVAAVVQLWLNEINW
ncbi:MAG: alpha/beta fold hydrolase [Actinomycetota bacterium]|nr:alpha/beta fold hydrolase [Actinomycetota bacterium]